MKKIILHGIIASALASVVGIVYQVIYQSALDCDFSKVINPISISMACIVGCLLISLGYILLSKFNLGKFKGWLNSLISILSFASIIGPIGTTLPLDINNPELFVGLIAPLHLLPALAFFTISSFFKYE
ncbi:MAG: hypothetical protein AAF611_18040 [Bacteroidota bacterium]